LDAIVIADLSLDEEPMTLLIEGIKPFKGLIGAII
jgi:hypothetical protein